MGEKTWILIVDDDQRMAKTLVDILQVKGFEAEAVHSGAEALDKIEEGVFDCVLTDIKMPGLDGVELYREIKAKQPDLPVVLMTAYSSEKQIQEALHEGAIAALSKPLDINSLLGFFSALRKELSVVIVDDDPGFCHTLGDILQGRGFTVTQVSSTRDVASTVFEEGQVVLSSMKLGRTDGLENLTELRKNHPHLPIILVTGYREEMTQTVEAGLKINAYTCLYETLKMEKLIHTLTNVHRQELGRILGKPIEEKSDLANDE